MDSHHLLLAGLPAHPTPDLPGLARERGSSTLSGHSGPRIRTAAPRPMIPCSARGSRGTGVMANPADRADRAGFRNAHYKSFGTGKSDAIDHIYRLCGKVLY